MASTPVIDQASADEMSLAVIKRIDPDVEQVLAAAGHVCLYHMSLDTQQWVRKNVEGSLFLLKRRKEPRFQMMVLNKLTTENYLESIHGGLDFEINPPYLMYTHGNSEIHGIWFYEKGDLDKFDGLLQRIKGQLPEHSDKAQTTSANGGDAFWDKSVDVASVNSQSRHATAFHPAASAAPQQHPPPPPQQQQQAAQVDSGGNNLANLLRHAAQKTQQQQQPPPPQASPPPAPKPVFVAMGGTPQPHTPQQPQQPPAGPAPTGPTTATPAGMPVNPLQLLSPAYFTQGGAAVNKLLTDVRKQPALSPASSVELSRPPSMVADSGNTLQRLFAKAAPPAVVAPAPAASVAAPPEAPPSAVPAVPQAAAVGAGPQPAAVPDSNGNQRERVRLALQRLLTNDAFVDAVTSEFKAAGLLPA